MYLASLFRLPQGDLPIVTIRNLVVEVLNGVPLNPTISRDPLLEKPGAAI